MRLSPRYAHRDETDATLPIVMIDPTVLHKSFSPEYEATIMLHLKHHVLSPRNGRRSLKMNSECYVEKWEAELKLVTKAR